MTSKERYELLDKLGLCHWCEKAKQFPGRKYCPECLEKIAARNARYRAELTPEKRVKNNAKIRERRARYKSEGRCVKCGNEVD